MSKPTMYKIGRRLTVSEYQRLGREGAFPDDARLELVDGEVREMPPIGVSHAWIVDQLSHALFTQLPNHHVRAQNPIDLDKYNEPQPDLVVARRTPAFKLRHPLPPDVLLVIEVSDSSLRQDRRGKIPRYARSGIPEAWIVDVGRERIHAFSEPAGITYQRETTFNRGEVIHSAAIPSLRLPVEAAFD